MPVIEIFRHNCDHCLWGMPNDLTGPNWVGATDMARYYIIQQLGRDVPPQEIRSLEFSFKPATPEDNYGHLKLGTLRIVYHLTTEI